MIRWIFIAAILMRIFLIVVFEMGLKYTFVLDNFLYEKTAWLMAKNWMSSSGFDFTLLDVATLNFYNYWLAAIFYLFGPQAWIGVVLNSLFSILTMFLILILTRQLFLHKESKLVQTQVLTVVAILLALYPSFIIWSATNIRDPMYQLVSVIFVFGVLMTNEADYFKKLGGFAIAGLSFWLIFSLRDYMGYLFLGACVWAWMNTKGVQAFGLRRWLILATVGVVGAVGVFSLFQPDLFQSWLQQVEAIRVSFANLGEDGFARSSFLLDFRFSSLFDLFMFWPLALLHYFLAPFPWDVKSAMQAFSLIEVLAIYVLLVPFFWGVRAAWRANPSKTVFLLSFLMVLVLFQALVVSNLGTIFRHRTVVFLFLTSFVGLGLYDWKKKNRSPVL